GTLGFSPVTLPAHRVGPQGERWAALAAVAGATERLRVGTLVLDNALRNPVLTAKAAATIDRLSGGRLELGLGAGYVTANFAAAGVSLRARPCGWSSSRRASSSCAGSGGTRRPRSPAATTRSPVRRASLPSPSRPPCPG